MGIVDFSCRMRPVVRANFGMPENGVTKLIIRLAALAGDNLPKELTGSWAWAIVQEVPGEKDRPIIGGQASSMTEAAARAHVELQRQEARLNAQQKKD